MGILSSFKTDNGINNSVIVKTNNDSSFNLKNNILDLHIGGRRNKETLPKILVSQCEYMRDFIEGDENTFVMDSETSKKITGYIAAIRFTLDAIARELQITSDTVEEAVTAEYLNKFNEVN